MMSDTTQNYQNVTVTNKENGEVTIEGELPVEKMTDARSKALEKMRENAEIDGFRKGTAPDDILIKTYGEMSVLQQAAEIALNEEYPHIIRDNNIDAIGQPQVSISKLAPGEPLGFTIQTATMPNVALPDYKNIAKQELKKKENQISEPEVEEKEVDDVILQLRRNMAVQQQSQNDAEQKDPSSIPEEQLPEIDDAAVQVMGFETVAKLREQIRENIKQEKHTKELEKQQVAIMDALIENSDITLPDIVVNSELDKMMQQLKHDIEQAGYTYEAYLEQVGKTDETIREEWRPQAIKKAKTQLILNKIVVEENIKPDKDEVNKQLEQIMEQYPNADREQANVFVETQLVNQKALKTLQENSDTNNAKKRTTKQKTGASKKTSKQSTSQKPKSSKASNKKEGKS